MEADHQEAQRQQEMIRGEMKQITNDVQLLTKQLNDAKLVNKGMLSEVETGVKRKYIKTLMLLLQGLTFYLNGWRFKSKLQIQLQKR